MKKIIFNLVIISSLFVSCGSDCELTDINEIIIGDWRLNGFDLSFNADGTIDDPENAFEASLNGIDLLDKTYELEGDTVLIVKSSNTEPPATLSTNFQIISYDCTEIKVSALLDFTFVRR